MREKTDTGHSFFLILVLPITNSKDQILCTAREDVIKFVLGGQAAISVDGFVSMSIAWIVEVPLDQLSRAFKVKPPQVV